MANTNVFNILKGPSTKLFDAQGNCMVPTDKLIENCWYLTTDTAEVYVALPENGVTKLKKLNECNIDSDFDFSSFDDRLTALERRQALTYTYGYRKDFPETGEINHFYVAADEHKTYIYYGDEYVHIADKFEYIDDDNNSETPEVRIIHGGSAN